jgi:hypothetical protein
MSLNGGGGVNVGYSATSSHAGAVSVVHIIMFADIRMFMSYLHVYYVKELKFTKISKNTKT